MMKLFLTDKEKSKFKFKTIVKGLFQWPGLDEIQPGPSEQWLVPSCFGSVGVGKPWPGGTGDDVE